MNKNDALFMCKIIIIYTLLSDAFFHLKNKIIKKE